MRNDILERIKKNIYNELIEYQKRGEELYPRNLRDIARVVGTDDINIVRRILEGFKKEGTIRYLEFEWNNGVRIQLC